MRWSILCSLTVILGVHTIPHTASAQEACWSEPLDLHTFLIRSDVIDLYDVDMEVANDFVMQAGSARIVLARWWGGYVEQAYYEAEGFSLRFYAENPTDPCLPGSLSAEFIVAGNAGETFVGYDPFYDPIYAYEAEVSFDVVPGVRYWFVCQAANHPMPPNLWGRIGASQVTGCESAFRSAYFGYPNWTAVSDLTGEPWDASQEFVCESPTATVPITWGRIRGLYR